MNPIGLRFAPFVWLSGFRTCTNPATKQKQGTHYEVSKTETRPQMGMAILPKPKPMPMPMPMPKPMPMPMNANVCVCQSKVQSQNDVIAIAVSGHNCLSSHVVGLLLQSSENRSWQRIKSSNWNTELKCSPIKWTENVRSYWPIAEPGNEPAKVPTIIYH